MTTLLMIDDEELFLKSMSRYFEGRGYGVVADSHAARALRQFDETPERFDLVLLDHEMPDQTGGECLKHIHARRPGLPVVIMSGYPPECIPADVRDQACAVLGKPMELADVEQAVRSCLK